MEETCTRWNRPSRSGPSCNVAPFATAPVCTVPASTTPTSSTLNESVTRTNVSFPSRLSRIRPLRQGRWKSRFRSKSMPSPVTEDTPTTGTGEFMSLQSPVASSSKASCSRRSVTAAASRIKTIGRFDGPGRRLCTRSWTRESAACFSSGPTKVSSLVTTTTRSSSRARAMRRCSSLMGPSPSPDPGPLAPGPENISRSALGIVVASSVRTT
mmetsp:Transcript_11316/g.32570  ORF Transcript_11316/g.32570 Transcript_11316/m.32570 type:complete len:212 (-) Transcript_11316:922-1557(-)